MPARAGRVASLNMIVVVHNSPLSGPGRLSAALDRPGVDRADVYLHKGEIPPPVDELSAVVLLGGEMAAYDLDEFPFLADALQLIRDCVAADKPVLGICLGSQLIAAALGGRVFKADRPEVGVIEIELTDAGRHHPVLGPLKSPVLAVHQDTFELPPGSVLLAESDRFPHAFELGSALALQFHPETPASEVQSWIFEPQYTLLQRAGVDPREFSADLEREEDRLETEAAALFKRWLGQVSRAGQV